MADFFEELIKSLEKFFKPLPHLPNKLKTFFLPIIPWYLFVRGLMEIISGLRSLSASFQFSALPKIFSRFLEVNPAFLFWQGIIILLAGILYFVAFTNLAQTKTQYLGWKNWLLAATLTTMIRLYQVIFNHGAIIWLVAGTLVGWFLIFEFQKFYKLKPKK